MNRHRPQMPQPFREGSKLQIGSSDMAANFAEGSTSDTRLQKFANLSKQSIRLVDK